MKIKLLMPLLLLPWLLGCVEDNSAKVAAAMAQPSIGGNNINFGLTYSGLTHTATLSATDILPIQAFFDSFVLAQAQEANISALATTILGEDTVTSVAGETTSTTVSGVCGGTSLLRTQVAADTLIFDNSLQFSVYCTDSSGWTGHVIESGKLTAYGTAANATTTTTTTTTTTATATTTATDYLMRFYAYGYSVESTDPFTVRMGGEVKIASGTAQSSQTLNQMVISQNTNNLTAFYQGWKATQYSDGTVYDGTLYHPSYGKVVVSTVANARVTTTDVGALKKPTSGKLKLVGSNSIGYITFVNLNSYTLEVDGNADGIIDFTQTNPW